MLHLALQIYVLLMGNGNFLINRQNWNVNNRSSSGVELVYRSQTLLSKRELLQTVISMLGMLSADRQRVYTGFSKEHTMKLSAKVNRVSKQCRATIGPPAKRHLNGVSLAGRWWPDFRYLL